MGSGDKFRFGMMHPKVWSLGLSVVIRGEHEVSISINLIKWEIYIGIGKGYEEFDR